MLIIEVGVWCLQAFGVNCMDTMANQYISLFILDKYNTDFYLFDSEKIKPLEISKANWAHPNFSNTWNDYDSFNESVLCYLSLKTFCY